MARREPIFDLQRLPPTSAAQAAQWNPRETLDIDLRIDADGQWRYRGSAITRARMVKLFASLLRLDADGRHYLVTPRIKYPIAVADAPFRAVELRRRGRGRAQALFFRTNVDDVVRADGDHPLHVGADAAPYIEVRDGLQAKLTRAVYHELAQHLESPRGEDADDDADEEVLGVYSAGRFFALGRAR